MTQRFHTEESLKARHFIEINCIDAEQKIADLKKEHSLLMRWKKMKTFLKQCFKSTERN